MGNCIITRRVYGEAVVPKVPVLNANFPEDHTHNMPFTGQIQLNIVISQAGIPAEYSYQWYKNSSKINGATSSTYTLKQGDIVLGQTRFYCMVTNAAGSVQSRVSIITFQNKPVLNESYPVNATVQAGNGTNLTVQVTSGFPTNYTYQWYKNGSVISGAKSQNYNISSVGMGQNTYYCSVTNSVGTTNSRTCTITGIKTPVLTSTLPADVTITASAGEQATFSVKVSTQGYPTNYTYQWYKNNSPISGATGSSYTATGLTSQQTATFYCKVTNSAGTVQSRTATLTVQSYLPTYTYTGSHQLINDGNFNWRLKLLTSGKLTFSHLGSGASAIDVFLVGGGGGGSDGIQTGGAGGYTKTVTEIVVNPNVAYPIIIGAGGSGTSNGNGVSGGESSAFGSRAAGGTGAKGTPEQNRGGSGGGGAHGSSTPGSGGSDGSNGAAAQLQGGYGQRSVAGPNGENGSTREFGAGDLYAGGGAGGSWYIGNENGLGGAGGGGNCAQPGAANTGGGGGSRYTNGTDHYPGGAGGSGIVIIRNKR